MSGLDTLVKAMRERDARNEARTAEIQRLSDVIKDAKKAIADVRASCPHDDKQKGLWMWAEGHTIPAIVCTYCGTFIEADNSNSCDVIITYSK